MKAKQLLYLALAICATAPISAHQYLQQNLSWQRTHYDQVWDYMLSIDTIINGTHYLTGEWLGIYRDDQSGMYEYNPLCNEDVLLFPYGAQIGDTLHISNLSLIRDCSASEQGVTPGWGDYYGVVTAVDTITLLNGEQRRRIFYRGGRHNWYIEGIGGPKGWRGETVDWELDDTDVWLCYYVGPNLLWTSDDCDLWTVQYPNACFNDTPKSATSWYCVEVYNDFPGDMLSNYTAVTYLLQGDTIFGDTIYQALRRGDGAYCGAVRNSPDGQQVYFRPGEIGGSYARSKGKEYLLYDFSTNVGDTVYAYDGFMDTSCEASSEPDFSITPAWKVLSKDTIDGRTHIQVEGGNQQAHIEWIEGIGTCNILFSRAMHCMSGYESQWTLCVADSNGNVLYSFNTDHLGIHNECPSWSLIHDALNFTQSDDSSFRKFLRNGQLLIETNLGTFDATGQIVAESGRVDSLHSKAAINH